MDDFQNNGSIDSTNIEGPLKNISAYIGKKNLTTKIQSGEKHIFYVDESVQWGGEDKYPDPWDYILGGLGACIAITLRQYADKHKINLESAEVDIEYSFDHNSKKDSKKSPYRVTKFLTLKGDLSTLDLSRLIEVSNSPAQKMLEQGIIIKTILR